MVLVYLNTGNSKLQRSITVANQKLKNKQDSRIEGKDFSIFYALTSLFAIIISVSVLLFSISIFFPATIQQQRTICAGLSCQNLDYDSVCPSGGDVYCEVGATPADDFCNWCGN